MKKISIIVPIFNGEKYLKSCIESILNQTYQNIELILVDDGSTDNSKIICKKFKDTRIKYCYKQNGGVSSARNWGIKKSTGDYIMFVDSDDLIDKSMVQSFVENLKTHEFIMCGYEELYCNNHYKHAPEFQILKNNKDIINRLLFDKNINGFPVNKIYSRQIIEKYNIYFDENTKFLEDVLFNIEYIKHIKRCLILPNDFYKYRMRESSASWTIGKNKSKEIITSLEKIDNLTKNSNFYNVQYIYFRLQLIYKYNIKDLKKPSNREYWTIIKSHDIKAKDKIKLYILKNFNVFYKYYMNQKVKNNKLYD